MAKTLIHFIKYPSNIFVALLVLVILISLDTTYGTSTIRFPLYHREKFIASHFNDERSLVLARLSRDKARFKHLCRRHDKYSNLFQSSQFPHPNDDLNETAVFEEGGEYVAVLKVGSPVQKVQLLVDIGTPFTWWQCQPNCRNCYSTPHHLFDTSMSSTYTEINCADDPCDITQLFIQGCIRRDDPKCHYRVQYGDGSVSQGVMAKEVVSTDEGVLVSNSFSFGCGRRNEGLTMFNAAAAGILGLVPGGYSFPSQFQANTFSLCLPTYNATASGALYMNHFPSVFQSSSKAILNIRKEHYYLGFSGIAINDQAIPIPPDFWECDPDGVGGVIIDTGSTITRFPKQVYDIFKDYFLRNAKGLPLMTCEDQLDTCFNVKGVEEWETLVPKVKFLFKWALGQPLEFETSRLLMSVGNGKYCLAFGAGGPTSVLGSWQLQGSLIGFDVSNHVVAFLQPYKCYSV